MLNVTAVVSKSTNRQSLVQGHDYVVIGIDHECYRIIDESGEPALYPHVFFSDSDIAPPEHWVLRKYRDDEYTYDPPELSKQGFYEDYADGVELAVKTFREVCQRETSS